ncbi:hypothetical protein [Pseudomonas rubra]|uniref:PepSY-associated TM region n=1 Tax=Pseudomonas rubra TaxID=2942627 RepID=A0ABT5PFF0_9PSED|nr:hypothetical protein [Pseudomonas rubra]MDD1017045.1 hypothetical protein [Pseudomonas rubra]MDD1037104.1 hypothetical protein [Pseudomonas rubra]MDD1153765.1 hypothetical protein [Pseudomonas rubra]
MFKPCRPWDSNTLGILALAIGALTAAVWLTLSSWIDLERGWTRIPRGGRTGNGYITYYADLQPQAFHDSLVLNLWFAGALLIVGLVLCWVVTKMLRPPSYKRHTAASKKPLE